MMKLIAAFLILCPLLSGSSSPGGITVTCKPQFEYEPRPELIATTRDGDRADASAQFLVITYGPKRYGPIPLK